MLGVSITLAACGNESSKSESEQETLTQSDEAAESAETEVQDEIRDESTRSDIEIDLSQLNEAKSGDQVELLVPGEEKSYVLIIQRVQEQVPGIKSISAHIDNKETGLATLSLRDGRLSGIIDVFKEGLRYRIGYDSSEDQYFILETEVKSREEKIGEDPMTPKLHDE